MTPHPRTIASIHLQGECRRHRSSAHYTVADCGCYVPDAPNDRHGWTLCPYHEGFDDACKEMTQSGATTSRPVG